MSNSTSNTINLKQYQTPGEKVFTGRDRGEEVRRKSHIDDLEIGSDRVVIMIPPDIFSINPSFLEEFLYNVVNRLGRDAFLEKFRFENPGEYKIDGDLEEAIHRILRKKSALQ